MPFKCSTRLLVLAAMTMSVGGSAAYARGNTNNGPAPAMKVWHAESDTASPAAAPPPSPALPGPDGSSTMSKAESIHQVLYRIYKAQRKYDLAEKESAALTAINPNNTLIHQDWGHELMLAQKWAAALPHYLKVTKIEPGNGDAWACVGDCYMQQGKYGAALDAYRKAVQFQKPGADYRGRYQIAQQYIDNVKQRQAYNASVKKAKEESDE